MCNGSKQGRLADYTQGTLVLDIDNADDFILTIKGTDKRPDIGLPVMEDLNLDHRRIFGIATGFSLWAGDPPDLRRIGRSAWDEVLHARRSIFRRPSSKYSRQAQNASLDNDLDDLLECNPDSNWS
jgi:hypothetical protein